MIALVTDSSACLTKEEAMKIGIRVVPLTYNVDGHQFTEGFSGSNGNYAELLSRAESAVTRQARTSVFASTFEELFRSGFEILCVVMSSRLSGTYSSARTAAQEIGGRVAVLDSQTTGAGLAYLLKYARSLADDELTLENITAACQEFRSRLGLGFSVDNIEKLRRSGRLGIVRQSVNSILNIRPVLCLRQGAIASFGNARGKQEQGEMLASMVPESADSITVHYFSTPHSTHRLTELLRKRFPHVPIRLCELGPVLGIHIGLGTIGVAWRQA